MSDPRIPTDEVDRLNIEIKRLHDEIADALSPSGTQRVAAVAKLQRTVDYLASLRTIGTSAGTLDTGTIPNDGVYHWWLSPAGLPTITTEIPTGRVIIECGVGEASASPATGFIIAVTSFKIEDANGNIVAGYDIGARTGRLFTGQRIGVGITTGPVGFNFSTTQYPGPYTITGAVGAWSAATNTGAPTLQFNTITLNAQVVGSGVPSA